MVSGQWYNQDGLLLQYGTQKQVPEIGGDYLVYGDTREVEQYIPLVPTQWSSAPQFTVAAPPTSFTGTTTFQAAGIQSLTTLFPLQITAPQVTTTSGTLILTNPQIFIESVEVETLVSVAGTGSITMSTGFVVTQAGTPSSSWVQATPNAGVQLLNAFPLTSSGAATVQGTAGSKTIYAGSPEGFTYNGTSGGVAVTTGGGSWVGTQMPLVTNAITPLPNNAYISTIVSAAPTNGLLKLRIRYSMYGNINY